MKTLRYINFQTSIYRYFMEKDQSAVELKDFEIQNKELMQR